MKLTKKMEAEITSVYDTYWKALFIADIETYTSVLDEKFKLIGTTESEVFFKSIEAVQFLETTADQVAGNIELRNRVIKIELIETIVLVTEQSDTYVKIDGDWSFYGKARVSTLIGKKKQEWKIIQMHLSFPDSKADEGQTIGLDKISRENIELRDAIKRRTIELENKNRELEIETALEKVRAASMAMHSSQELIEVALELRKQMGLLGQKDLEVCAIHLYDENNTFESWSAMRAPGKESKILQTQARFPNKGIKIVDELMKQNKRGSKDYVLVNEGEKSTEWLNVMKKHAPELHASITKSIGKQLKSHWSVADFTGGALIMVTYGEPDVQTRNLLRRSANVFEQAYIRFLDLKKAEAQTREAQIEAALERVRAASMAMRDSSALSEIIYKVYVELTKLDAQLDRCFIMIVNPENKGMTWWMAGYEGLLEENGFFIPMNQHASHLWYLNCWKNRKKKWQYLLEGKEKKDWDRFGFSKTALTRLPEPVKLFMAAQKKVHLSGSSDQFGSLVTGSFEPLPEDQQNIISRFTIAFNQVYIRFLDLQKAEAQAREAQIEMALERVRSRSLAMHSSGEMGEVVTVVLNNLTELGYIIDQGAAAHLAIFSEGTKDFVQWSADPSLPHPTRTFIPYTDLPILSEFWDARQKGHDFYAKVYSFEEKNTWFKFAFEHSGLKHIPAELKKLLLESETYAHSIAIEKNSAIIINSITGNQLSENQVDILRRFSKVFEQAYVRFLDLQKAEAQTKESQIQLALERVRARTMAMQQSTELQEAANVLFQQMQSLSMPAWSAGYSIWDDDKQGVTLWMSSEGVMQPSFHTPLTKDPSFIHMREAHEKGLAFHVEEVGGKALVAHYKYLRTLPVVGDVLDSIVEAGHPLPTFQIFHCVYFSEGFLLFITYEPVPDAYEIFKRFGNVFDQTYTRFNDLQKVEAQAEIARLNLIQIHEEKQRAETALLELQATQKQLIQSEKMASLGELTAGIAHEIQNPLNFVNNFSEVSTELVDEMNEEIDKGNLTDVKEIANDLKQNLEKINHHGKRAGDIVKGMLQHSRSTNNATKEPTDINALADEYLRLAYHGLRAKDKSFNATLKTDFDENLGNINIIPQDIGRVILNLITNAFYVVAEKKKISDAEYDPTVHISTKKVNQHVIITVTDNGNGIPEKVIAKIFQPFFTTKPAGQGTGLGLSMSFDIVTKGHGGTLTVTTEEGVGTTFTITLPR